MMLTGYHLQTMHPSQLFKTLNYPRDRATKSEHSHFQDPVPLGDAGSVCRSTRQDGADMLQRGVQFSVNAPQLPALAHLPPNVKAVPRVRLHYPDEPRPR